MNCIAMFITAKFYTFFFSWGYFYFSAGTFCCEKNKRSLYTVLG